MGRRITVVLVVAAMTAACSSGHEPRTAEAAAHRRPPASTTTTALRPAPWAGAQLPASAPHPRSTGCRPMSFADLGDGAGASPRSNGEAIAWDKPGVPGQNPDGSPNPTSGRSAFGILETHIPAVVDRYPIPSWAFHTTWADGSEAGYGYEGETNPRTDPNPLDTTKWLAQVRVTGVECAIDVWSNLGKQHLEFLLQALRFVAAA